MATPVQATWGEKLVLAGEVLVLLWVLAIFYYYYFERHPYLLDIGARLLRGEL